MNRLAVVLPMSLAVLLSLAASAGARPEAPPQRAEKGGPHGSPAPPATVRPTPRGNPPPRVPAVQPAPGGKRSNPVPATAPVKKPSGSAGPTAPKSSGQGANVSGPYDPSGVGQPSGNGKGTGGNRPCAGCVGNADDKNPPGQMPGGSDRNAGYECDRNQGIGKTNPAHSGCSEESSTPLIESLGSPEAVIGMRAAAVKLAKSGAAPPLVPTGSPDFRSAVLGAHASGHQGAAGSGPGAGSGSDPSRPSETRSVGRSFFAGGKLPVTGLGLGVLALIGAAFGASGLLLRKAMQNPVSSAA